MADGRDEAQRDTAKEPAGGAALLLYVCFFLSGAAALAYEVAWLRDLELIFGGTSHAAATVLAAFMAGLALGSWRFGQRVGGWARPLRTYARLELGIGIYALMVPLVLGALESAYPSLRLALGAGPLLFGIVRFTLCFVALLPATVLMGATLPVVSQHWSRLEGPLVGGIGRLYGVNTLGAVVGVVGTGFFLLPTLGYTLTIAVAVVVNVAVAAVAFRLSWRFETSAEGREPDAAPEAPSLAADEVGALVALAFTGFAAMVLQVAWTRMLGLVLGPSTYAFSIMLATFLVGLGLGAVLVAWGLETRGWQGRRTFWVLAAVSGLLSLGTLGMASELPILFARLFYAWEGGLSVGVLFAIEALICAAALFLPTLAMGGLFPAALAAAGLSRRDTGAAVGRLYAGNTVGAVLGAFAGGFLLIPALGVAGTITGAAFVYMAVGAAFGVGGPEWAPRPALVRAASVVVAGLAAAALIPAWNPAVMTSGIYEYVSALTDDFTREEFNEYTRGSWELVYYKDGPTSTVAVALQPERVGMLGGEEVPNLVYMTDGKADASSVGDMATQVMLAHAPLLLHPAPRDVVVVGLASGTTAGSVLTHAVRGLDVVEIEPAAVGASHLFDFVNGRPLDDRRTTLHLTDARSYLTGTAEQYDVIISEPSNPWMAGPANLFTREFFEIGSRTLAPGGIFAQWIHTYSLHPELLQSVIATFHSVFPHVYLFHPLREVDLILVGSLEPLDMDVARMAARWQVPAVRSDLERVGLREFGDVMAQIRLGPDEVELLSTGARLNTDDNGLVLFGAPRWAHVTTEVRNDEFLTQVSRGVGEYLSFPDATPEIEERFLSYLAGAYGAAGHALAASVALRLAQERGGVTAQEVGQ